MAKNERIAISHAAQAGKLRHGAARRFATGTERTSSEAAARACPELAFGCLSRAPQAWGHQGLGVTVTP